MSKPIIRMNAADLSNPNFGPAPADYIIEGEPIESAHEYYEKDGCAAGVWVCSPGRTLDENHNEDEFCTIIGGKVGLIDNETNSEEIFTAGDSFFLPKGSNLTWVIYETVSKYYFTSG
ncbi:MAG: hypothetical protein CMQ19_12780 [Gammaproteobacteria bacterium]|jgi:uncharacterized cupin superfamily protein|nr:hypothetical protein [Gammaproteobacteria bacterium]|tara:strand:+ start:9145 stop:9498 length:354 start_codon:yes stop_codon:yes gene_type:complete